MKKIYTVALSLLFISNQLLAQQPMTISPRLVVSSPTAGQSGLTFTNLNANSSASTTPTKVLSVDASGNVILGNVNTSAPTAPAINVPTYANLAAVNTAIPSPVGGMVVNINTSVGSILYYYNGTEWTQFPNNSWVLTGSGTTAQNTLAGTAGMVVGNNSLANANVAINTAGGTDAVPDLDFMSTNDNHILRFGASSGLPCIGEFTTTNNLPASSSFNFGHVNSSTTSTNMMNLTGTGDLTIHGFTKLGGSGADVPAIKTKILSGNTTATTTVAHGLTASKIIACTSYVQNGTQYFAPNDFDAPTAARYKMRHDATNITLTGNSSFAAKPYVIYITYTE